jgi:hypothetical protein
VISPAITAKLVFVNVSQATRESLSPASNASRTESEILSDTLSG